MAVNIERFKNDLQQLIKLGQNLEFAMTIDLIGRDEFRKRFFPGAPEGKAKAVMDTFPGFSVKI